MSIMKNTFGTMPDGREVYSYILKNKLGASAQIITYGGTLNSLYMPDRDGVFKDVILGFDDLRGHIERSDYQGMIVGRYANRIANGRFRIGDKDYDVTINEKGITSLHGGGEMSHDLWDAEIISDNTLRLHFFSPDGSNGFPGNLKVTADYTLSEDNALSIEYRAVSDKDTIINLTNHAYFNLKGYDGGDILDHVIEINADYFTPTDENSIPTGELRAVRGTPFDFTSAKEIGRDIGADCEQLNYCGGYDHNFCLREGAKPIATVYEPKCGRGMEVYTDLPGVQLYCGNFLSGKEGKGGTKMGRHTGFCLETQYYPDTPNQPDFPQCTFSAGKEYKTKTVYKFNCVK